MSSQRPPDRQVYQDYIAKIRYSNQLPPPPGPPKLLDVPGTGLGPKYTSAGYASRLVREQPLNIEADAELGMPIDLIGIPGVFDGNLAAIMADPRSGPMHAADKALLRPLASIGKGLAVGDSTSFLRRTEYTASSGPQMFASGSSKDLLRLQRDPKRRSLTQADKDDPKNVLRGVIKGFDIAYPQDATQNGVRGAEITAEEAKAWSNPKHPSKSSLKLLDSYPILPDLEALPETGSFIVTKFSANPASRDFYEERLNYAILQPIAGPQITAEFERKKQERGPDDPEPLVNWDYDYFLPEPEAVQGIKRKFDVQDPEHDDEAHYNTESADGRRIFEYARQRRYETSTQNGDPSNLWNDSLGLALHNPETDVGRVPGTMKRLGKGAYIYPVSQKSALKSKRKVGAAALEQQDIIDRLNVTARDLEGDEAYAVFQEQKAQWDPTVQVPTNGVVTAEA